MRNRTLAFVLKYRNGVLERRGQPPWRVWGEKIGASHLANLDTPKALWSKARGWRLVEQRETNRLPRVSTTTPSRRYAEGVAPFPVDNAFSVADREGKDFVYPG